MNGHILPGTCIAVDFWSIKGRQENFIHFLTHVHGDHIVGLTSSWNRPIYCSDFTAQILEAHYGVQKLLLKVLPLNQCTLLQIPNSTDTFCVTAFDANHCPGALMLCFEGKFGNILHTGDFRFSYEMMTENLHHLCGKIDKLYFDNTFCSQDCVFPSREECLKQIIEIARNHPSSDILIGIRKLGKESMLAKLGVALNETIFTSPERFQISQCLFDCNVFSVPNKDEKARIRTMPLHSITRKLVHKLNQNTPTIAILPTAIFTGLSCKPFCRDNKIFVVPYSDHSSFSELLQFVRKLQPSEIIPVVKQARGPFGQDISNRFDMSLFKSYLDMNVMPTNILHSRPQHDINCSVITTNTNANDKGANIEIEFNHSDSNGDASVVSSTEPDKFIIDKPQKKFLLFDCDSTVCEKKLISLPSVKLKRKHSFPNNNRKKKVAKGVVFEESGLPPEKTLLNRDIDLKSDNGKNISSKVLSFQNDTLENLLVGENDTLENLLIGENDTLENLLVGENNTLEDILVRCEANVPDQEVDEVEISSSMEPCSKEVPDLDSVQSDFEASTCASKGEATSNDSDGEIVLSNPTNLQSKYFGMTVGEESGADGDEVSHFSDQGNAAISKLQGRQKLDACNGSNSKHEISNSSRGGVNSKCIGTTSKLERCVNMTESGSEEMSKNGKLVLVNRDTRERIKMVCCKPQPAADSMAKKSARDLKGTFRDLLKGGYGQSLRNSYSKHAYYEAVKKLM